MEKEMEGTVLDSRDSATVSIWQDSIDEKINTSGGQAADTSRIYDCLIIGAGITGITTGLLLQSAGLKCVIAEAEHVGFGTTGGTSAHLNTFFDATYPEVERDFGKEGAALFARAGLESMEMIKNFVQELNIDCDLEPKSAWLYAEDKQQAKELKEILDASKKAGIAVEEVDQSVVSVPFESVICFAEQGQFHPLKYVKGLLTEFIALDGVLLEHTRIRETMLEEDVYIANSDSVSIRVKKIFYATHVPPGINLMSMRNAPYRSYVLGLKLKDGNYPEGLAYDMQEPYHYFRTHVVDGQLYLIVGGEDHKTGHGDPELAFQNLEQYAKQYYEIDSVDYRWSAQYYVPVDGLPYIGQLPGAAEGTYVATGFNGNGMMLGTISAKIIADLVMERENEYADLFSPSRMKPVAGFREFVKENADVAWHFIADRFSSEVLKELSDLDKGEGKLVRYQGKQLAVYKDDSGKVTALNPTCTHAGCTVLFNPSEKSWDCPCHGGRFDVSGKVLNGPPTKDLEAIVISYDV